MLADGTRLSARIWLPEDAERDPVPAVLEYLPYRKHDGTAARDAVRQPYLAGHGYAAVRVDIRGSGESDGILEDEYTAQELADAVEVIAWLAAQPWCSGAVGMTGISWGGFNALQVAALRPPALRAVMTLCSTDDRYADDVHYRGGCVLATDMLHWASSMLTWNARPPDPLLLPGHVARGVARPPRADAAVRRALARAPAPRRVLAARLGLRGLLGDRGARLRGRRLRRRVHERRLPPARRAVGAAQGARRAVGSRLPRRRRARAEHRLAAGVRALVGRVAEGPRDGDHGRADAARVRARLGAAAAELRRPRGALGRGRPSGRRRASSGGRCRSRRSAARAPAGADARHRGRRLVRRGHSRPTSPATSAPTTRSRRASTSRRSPSRSSCSASPPSRSSWPPTGRLRSSASASATSRPTAPRRSSRAACSTSRTARATSIPCRSSPGSA